MDRALIHLSRQQGRVMQRTAINGADGHAPGWPHGVAVPVRLGAQRGVPLLDAGACDPLALVERVLRSAQLDQATRECLARILTITVRDWVRK